MAGLVQIRSLIILALAFAHVSAGIIPPFGHPFFGGNAFHPWMGAPRAVQPPRLKPASRPFTMQDIPGNNNFFIGNGFPGFGVSIVNDFPDQALIVGGGVGSIVGGGDLGFDSNGLDGAVLGGNGDLIGSLSGGDIVGASVGNGAILPGNVGVVGVDPDYGFNSRDLNSVNVLGANDPLNARLDISDSTVAISSGGVGLGSGQLGSGLYNNDHYVGDSLGQNVYLGNSGLGVGAGPGVGQVGINVNDGSAYVANTGSGSIGRLEY